MRHRRIIVVVVVSSRFLPCLGLSIDPCGSIYASWCRSDDDDRTGACLSVVPLLHSHIFFPAKT